jgi:hypothetical protein
MSLCETCGGTAERPNDVAAVSWGDDPIQVAVEQHRTLSFERCPAPFHDRSTRETAPAPAAHTVSRRRRATSPEAVLAAMVSRNRIDVISASPRRK